MVYHVFNLKKNKVWYKLDKIYTDKEFDEIMDKIKYLPYNVSVFHFESEKGENQVVCTNTVMSKRQSLDFTIEALLFNSAGNKMRIRSKEGFASYKALGRCGDSILIEYESPYNKVIDMDGGQFSIIADYTIKPLSFKSAKEFVNKYHRHNAAPQGHKFSIGIALDNEIVGVIIASEPKARYNNDGYTLELNRCCVKDNLLNACSILYSRAIQAGRAMGYKRFITYTLQQENGSSLKSVGFKPTGLTKATNKGWNHPSRPRKIPDRYPTGAKIKWELTY